MIYYIHPHIGFYADVLFIMSLTATLNPFTGELQLINSASSGGGSLAYEIPSGIIDGSNTIFTPAHTPVFIVTDSGIPGPNDWSYSGGNITVSNPPTRFIISFYT